MPGKALCFHPGPLRGSAGVPGDKSISHRALIAGACVPEPLRIANLNPGRDVRATREALAALGARIESDATETVVHAQRLRPAPGSLDCMNSGSTARMLLGACSGANVPVRMDGDASLRRRPMEPVAAQLRAFGARIETSEGRLPLSLAGTPEIQTRRFILLAPSAQVKSALLFAGLFGGVPVRIDGDRGSRDHTERLLRYLGAGIEWNGRSVTLSSASLTSRPVTVAGDFSSAAFFITAAAVTPGSAIVVRDVGVNPSRTGLLDALQAMGAAIELRNGRVLCEEPVADIAVEHAPLHGTQRRGGTRAARHRRDPVVGRRGGLCVGLDGNRRRRGFADQGIRPDRCHRAAAGRGRRGVLERSSRNGDSGGSPVARDTVVETDGDHRIAMSAAVLACGAGPLAIDGDDSVDVSFPGFLAVLAGLCGG